MNDRGAYPLTEEAKQKLREAERESLARRVEERRLSKLGGGRRLLAKIGRKAEGLSDSDLREHGTKVLPVDIYVKNNGKSFFKGDDK